MLKVTVEKVVDAIDSLLESRDATMREYEELEARFHSLISAASGCGLLKSIMSALATIAKIRKVNLPEEIEATGERILSAWKELGARHDLPLSLHGLPALCSFEHPDALMLKTMMTFEMLNRGFPANTAIYPILSHTEKIVDEYLAALAEVFAVLKEALDAGDLRERYDFEQAHSGFARLT